MEDIRVKNIIRNTVKIYLADYKRELEKWDMFSDPVRRETIEEIGKLSARMKTKIKELESKKKIEKIKHDIELEREKGKRYEKTLKKLSKKLQKQIKNLS